MTSVADCEGKLTVQTADHQLEHNARKAVIRLCQCLYLYQQNRIRLGSSIGKSGAAAEAKHTI